MGRSEAITGGVQVKARSFYVPERSAPDRDLYFFGYRIVIANTGESAARLLARHWVITDGNEQVQEVRGPGVVGETPHLEPGESFEYTSSCPMRTPRGTMRGSYTMARDDGRTFEAEIGPFTLEMPHSLN